MKKSLEFSASCILFCLLGVSLPAQEPFRQLGRAHLFAPEDAVPQSIWLPYWAERDGHHATLHLRNVMLHTPLDLNVEVFQASGKQPVATVPARLEAAGNLDLDLATLVPSSLTESDRAGSIRISFQYPLAGVVQAEVSILDEKRNHAYTIVGRNAHPSVWETAYLAFRAPTATTYLETAFLNPGEREITVDLQLLGGQGWQAVERIVLQPREMRKLRVPSSVLAQSRTSSDRTALLRAIYSVSVSEVVANAWLEDETTGFSNTVLFHEVRPQSSTLYGAQFVVKGFPRDLLPDGPDFEAFLVLANVDQLPQAAIPTLYCDIAGQLVERELAPLTIEAEQTVSLSLNKVLADQFGHASEAICSAEIAFTGTPGTLFGRYFAESSTLTYGLYAKLESGLGRAFNELYWNVDGDKTPLLTVTNFSDTMERIDIWATRDQGSKILRTVELPAKASVHLNMRREFAERSAELSTLQSAGYGGFHIRAENPTAKVLVKEHIFSLSKQVASPYYGQPDYLYSHAIVDNPSWMTVGQGSTAETWTCYNSGCFYNEWFIYSSNASVLSVQNLYLSVPRNLTAHSPGNALLESQASGPVNPYGDMGYFDAYATVSVYDATPVINAIVPSVLSAGESRVVEIWGLNFGGNPTVHAAPGITVGIREYASNNQINVRLTHNPGFPPGQYNIWVTSNGYSGSGFQQAPGGGSQAQSNTSNVGVVCSVPSISSLSPDSLLVSKAVQVTIAGSNFTPSTSVSITGGVTVSNVVFESASTVKASIAVSTSATEGVRNLTVSTCGGTSNSKNFSVRVPKKLVRISYQGAPGGIGPLQVIAPENVVDLNGNIQASNQCGVYRNYAFRVLDSAGQTVDIPFSFTEKFSNYTGPSGSPAPPQRSFQMGNGEYLSDVQYLGLPWPSCLQANDHEIFDMTFGVTINSTEFPLTTKLKIERGRFDGVYKVDSTITIE